jgi:hypothetical protein
MKSTDVGGRRQWTSLSHRPWVLLCAGFFSLTPWGDSQAQTTPNDRQEPVLTAEDWREDLHYMALQMRLKHKSLFHTVTEAEFNKAVEKLDADIPHLNRDEVVVRFAEIGVLIQDGHSGVELRQFPPGEHKDRIPVRFDRYPDGIYVRAAAPAYVDAVGGKVVRVGTFDWQEAIRRVDSLQSHDPGNNGEQLAWSAKTYLNCPYVLHGLGLSTSDQSADFEIEKNGETQRFTLKASEPIGKWHINSVPTDWTDARPKSTREPLSRRHEDQPYWFTYLPESHAIYFQFNLVMNGDEETLAKFAVRLASALEQPEVQRLVIDLRNNTGGNNTLLRPLLVALIRSKQNERGRMFAILGPTTFSAAQNFVNRLENFTEVVFVGEPTAENVNFFGDAARITLPHSQLGVGVSHLWWQDKDPRDRRTATFPEIAIAPSFRDYVAGSDPMLEYALTAPKPERIDEVMEAGLAEGRSQVLSRYKAYVADPKHKFLGDAEERVNALGYRLLSEKRVADAIVVFEVNVSTHPSSWNAYDSLGEAYVASRDKQRALGAYRKSLELNPENANGRQMLEKIEKAP